MSNTDAKLLAVMQRVDRLEHALLVLATWHHGQAEYVRCLLGPEAVQCSEVQEGYQFTGRDVPIFEKPKGES